jgi:hypothetical protein
MRYLAAVHAISDFELLFGRQQFVGVHLRQGTGLHGGLLDGEMGSKASVFVLGLLGFLLIQDGGDVQAETF